MNRSNHKSRRFQLYAAGLVFAGMVAGGSAWADGGANHQVRNKHFGVSGSNIKDISKAFCCGGTLGSLLTTSGGVQYILSNNHILARSDQAAGGEDISQPGLIDNSCRPATIVADFTTAPPLGSNVDAAIAQLRAGQMDATGFIEDIGVPSSIVRAPAIGLAVAKSGRTTGLTTGSIGSINTTVNVQYQRGCGSGKKFVVSYTNQVVTNGSLSAGGDSGSLIVSNDACHQPVALLFAGSSTTTIGNPIGEVLSKVGTALGSPVAFVGGTGNCATSSPAGPSQSLVAHATSVKEAHAPSLMARGQVLGVGVSAADDNPLEAVIVIYIERTAGVVPDLPDQVEGVRVKRIFTDPFVAHGCCEKCRAQ